MRRYFIELLVIVLLSVLAAIPMSFPIGDTGPTGTNYFVLGYFFLFFLPLQYGVYFAFLRAVQTEKPYMGDILEFFNNYISVIIAQVLVYTFIAIGLAMLIIPGIYIMCKLAFVPYLVTYERTDALEALRISWRITRGYAWTVFRIWLLALPIYLLGIIVFGVGVLVSMIWVTLSYSALYYRVAEDSELLQQYRSRQEEYATSSSHARREPSKTSDQGLSNLLDRDE